MPVYVNRLMEIDKEFMKKWKETPRENKESIRATLLKEAKIFLHKKAFEDFGIHQSSISMELSKLILIARDCLEKQEKKK